ncbi:energy transducer TonB [Mucilaginibacter sp. R-33]|uniref:energy transducer TonB n=1 Tax=Mucilaginibacter sp. R-33 TaxID=3416711 RepID=UPI003CF42BFC
MKHVLLIAFLFVMLLPAVKAQTTKIDTSVYTEVEQLPEFPGGVEKLKEYISNTIKKSPLKDLHSGLVIITFIIENNGSITNTHVTKGLTSETDSLAIDIIKRGPKWKPAQQRSKTVRCLYSVPVLFGKGNDIPAVVKKIKER